MRSLFPVKLLFYFRIVAGLAAISMRAQSPPSMNLMPMPAKVQTGSGLPESGRNLPPGFLRVTESRGWSVRASVPGTTPSPDGPRVCESRKS